MRYKTCGDWFHDQDKNLVIQVSDEIDGRPLGDTEKFLIALHELIEVKLCEARGITQDDVDQFDLFFKGEGEPGDDPKAPYRLEHRFACLIEFLVAHELGLTGYGKVE